MDEPANEPVQKAHRAMDHLLMAYSAMMEYTFEGAIELRAATMEVIHALESLVTVPPGEPVVIDYGYDEEDYKKEIDVVFEAKAKEQAILKYREMYGDENCQLAAK